MRILALLVAVILILAVKSYIFSQESVGYDPRGKRDPFVPLVDKDGNILPEARPAGSVIELNLEGVLWDERGESYAIISGTVLKVGDLLGDYKVTKIEPRKVTLLRGAEEFVLSVITEEE